MRSWRKLTRAMVITLSVTAGLTAGRIGMSYTQTASETKSTMRQLYATLVLAYGYGLDAEAFADPANRKSVVAALRALADSADRLEKHGVSVDPSFGYLQGSVSVDASEALYRYEHGEFTGSRYVLSKMTQSCMTCHSRTASSGDVEFGTSLLEQANVRSLSLLDRVAVEVAVRQFETAMNTYEEILRDPTLKPVLINMGGTYEGYLRLCLGVANDTKRPAQALEAHGERVDMPDHMKKLVVGWVEALEGLDLAAAEGKELSVANGLVADAQLQKRFVSDRARLVELVAAEVLAHRFLQSQPADKTQIAQAFYVLALAESNVSRSYWIAETPFLLEHAIRGAPKSPWARKAYEFYEEYTLSAYAGVALPHRLEVNLEEMRTMIGD